MNILGSGWLGLCMPTLKKRANSPLTETDKEE